VPEWARMPSEWKFVVYSSIIKVHFKHSDYILCAFQIIGHILVTGRNVLLVLKTFKVHSKWRNIERHLKCILTALWLLSKYSYSIPTAFHTFWSHSRENQNGIDWLPLRILSECPECVSNEFEYTSNASGVSGVLPETNSIWKEFSWNAIQMPSETVDSRSIAARMQLERPVTIDDVRNSYHHPIVFYVLSPYTCLPILKFWWRSVH